MDPEEVRTKKQASATQADTTTEPDAATEAATADVPDEVTTENQQSIKVIMKETKAKEPLDGQNEAEVVVTDEAEIESKKKKLQAQFENKPTIKARNQGLDLPKGSYVAAPVFEDAGNLESGKDDARNQVNYNGAEEGGSVQDKASGMDDARDDVNFDEAKEDASVQIIADVLDLMLDAKVQARQEPLNTAVKFVTAVSCDDVEKELLNLINEDSVHTKGGPKMKVEDWSLVFGI